jgi:hypothetical protein
MGHLSGRRLSVAYPRNHRATIRIDPKERYLRVLSSFHINQKFDLKKGDVQEKSVQIEGKIPFLLSDPLVIFPIKQKQLREWEVISI